MRPTVLAAALVAATAAPAQPPEPERWVRVETSNSSFLVRLAGGPPTQVVLRWAERPEKGEMRNIEGLKQARFGFLVGSGTQFAFLDGPALSRRPPMVERGRPELQPAAARLMVSKADGSDPRVLLEGVGRGRRLRPAAGGKAVYCEAQVGENWHVFRVPLDGTPPVRLTRTAGRFGVEFYALADGRVLYRPETNEHRVPYRTASTTATFIMWRGPAILTDGKTETPLVPEAADRLPAITNNGTKLAVSRQNAAAEEVVEVRDLKAGTAHEYRVKAFHPDWKPRFGLMAFSPDGQALAVTFELPVLGSDPAAEPAVWRATRHVGLIWLDGRPNPRELYEVNDPRPHGSGVTALEWAGPPPATP